jgi:hypothetical protein
MRIEMTSITLTRTETHQIRRFEPLQLTISIEAEIGDGQNAEAEIKRLSELIGKSMKEQFNKELPKIVPENKL